MTKTRNDLTSPVPKFCLGLETSRRTTEGRVRTAGDLVAHFFPYSDSSAEDRIFHLLPRDVRGPILTAWGVRAQKSALRDSDDKVRSVVHDALVAGDLDAATFEDALTAEILMRWIDLPDWWSFWRSGKLGKYSILKALESGYELGLFDAEWFLETVRSKDGKVRGTDVLCEGLSKADLTEWLRAVYQGGDGSPKGIVAALGWDQIVAKTTDDVLVSVLDAMAGKVGLKAAKAETAKTAEASKPVEAAKAPDAGKPSEMTKAGEAPKAAKDAPTIETKDNGAKARRPVESAAPLDTWTPRGGDGSDARLPEIPKLPGVLIASTPSPADTKSVEAKPAEPKLPGIPIPATARANDAPVPPPPASQEELSGEAAANLFKDEEMIPISAETMEDEVEERELPKPPSVRPGAKKDGKRPSKIPPARGAKV